MRFEAFTAPHYAALAAAAAVFALLLLFRRRLRGERANRRFRIALASVLLLSEASLQLSYVLDGNWSAGSLPLQLCSLMLLLSAAALLFRVKTLYSAVFFLGSLGAFQAMLTPNLAEPFPQFRYFHFFIAHIAIIAAALYLFAVERYRPTMRSMFGALLWLHLLAVPAAAVNAWTGTTNFMFLAGKPATASLLDLLAPWPWYILQLELVAVALCLTLVGLSKAAEYWFVGRKKP